MQSLCKIDGYEILDFHFKVHIVFIQTFSRQVQG